MSKVFFFTDLHLLIPQPHSQAFGPVDGESQTEYRLTSKYTAFSNPQAYAITGGAVLAQVDTANPNLLNLILKPNDQGEATFGHIKFIVHLEPLNYAALDIVFTYFHTVRYYSRPEAVAAFIGALVDVGAYVDTSTLTHPFRIISEGSAFPDGTGFPSLEHNDSYAIDVLYQNHSESQSLGIGTVAQRARDQSFINATQKFGATRRIKGTNSYCSLLTNWTLRNALHDSHFHFGEIVANDCEETL